METLELWLNHTTDFYYVFVFILPSRVSASVYVYTQALFTRATCQRHIHIIENANLDSLLSMQWSKNNFLWKRLSLYALLSFYYYVYEEKWMGLKLKVAEADTGVDISNFQLEHY